MHCVPRRTIKALSDCSGVPGDIQNKRVRRTRKHLESLWSDWMEEPVECHPVTQTNDGLESSCARKYEMRGSKRRNKSRRNEENA